MKPISQKHKNVMNQPERSMKMHRTGQEWHVKHS